MRLIRVTISGADDGVDPEALSDLSREFAFVEWGILFSRTRGGTARYPSFEWRARFAVQPTKSALHLCGEASRFALAGDITWPDDFLYDRVQLNGFSKYRLPFLLFARAHHQHEIILQCDTGEALIHAVELTKLDSNISALWDASGGRGQAISRFPCRDGIATGYAGGLGPDNLLERLGHLRQNTHAKWVDMESGIRTDDRFDLTKVRRVLELVKPFMEVT